MKITNRKKKALSILLTIVMLLGMMPMAAYATETTTYTITYTDGVGGTVFADQVYTVEEGSTIPYFTGNLEREGYIYDGWTPALEYTVTADATYTAVWKECVGHPTHSYYGSDATNHWSVCGCGYTVPNTASAHTLTWQYNEERHWQDCVCNYGADTIEQHSFESDADTSCDCGYTRTIEHTHEWSNYESNGDGSHTRICTTDNSHRQKEDCGGTATCHELATCPDCGASHGEYNKNNHVGGTEVRDDVDAGEFTDGYTGDTYCLGCGDLLSKGESIPSTHVHNHSIQYNDTHHWKECSCGDIRNLAAHDGYANDGSCDYCGYHVHVWHQRHNADGTHTRTCKFDSSHVEIEETEYGYYWTSDKTTHWKVCNHCAKNDENWDYHVYDRDSDPICNICGYRREDSTHAHRYAFATCVSPALCSCGVTSGEKIPTTTPAARKSEMQRKPPSLPRATRAIPTARAAVLKFQAAK